MSVFVKICGITRVEDARAAAAAGADAIGLMFHPASPRNVTLERATEISRALPPTTTRVGVFVNPAPEFVRQAVAGCRLDVLQFHGDEPPEFCASFAPVRVWKAFRIRDAASLDVLPSYATDAWLLDAWSPAARGGTGERFNWDLAVQAGRHGRPIVLAGGLTAANVAAAVRQVRPWGVDVSSGVESAPGLKDVEKIRAFVDAVRTA